MFEVFLKAKLEIEAKVNRLQTDYIELLRSPIAPIEFSENNSIIKAEEILREKLENLEEVKAEYTELLLQYEDISSALSEAKELSDTVESQIDQLFESLELGCWPEDLRKPKEEYQQKQPEKINEKDFYEDKENSQIYQEEEATADNSGFKDLVLEDSIDEYFSPNIQIRKYSQNTNSVCYTPAVKSHSKTFSRDLLND